jgi:hypothetical protein
MSQAGRAESPIRAMRSREKIFFIENMRESKPDIYAREIWHRVTLHILFMTEIYAREMLPFLTFWKAPLRREDDLISIESLYDSLSMIHIELSEEIIK